MLPRRLLGFTTSPPLAVPHCPCIRKAPCPGRLSAYLALEQQVEASPMLAAPRGLSM